MPRTVRLPAAWWIVLVEITVSPVRMRGLKREPVPETRTSAGRKVWTKSAVTIAPLVTPTPVTAVMTRRPRSRPVTKGKPASRPERRFWSWVWIRRISEGIALRISVSAGVDLSMAGGRAKGLPCRDDFARRKKPRLPLEATRVHWPALMIEVENLTRVFRTYKKQPGFWGGVKGLVKRDFEETRAADNVSFSIKEGELVGFLGPNGAGKTTTLKML